MGVIIRATEEPYSISLGYHVQEQVQRGEVLPLVVAPGLGSISVYQ